MEQGFVVDTLREFDEMVRVPVKRREQEMKLSEITDRVIDDILRTVNRRIERRWEVY